MALHRIASVLAGLLAALFGSELASALPVEFQFTGRVVSADGIWAGQGDEVRGTYSLDDELIPDEPGDATLAGFFSEHHPQALFRLTVSVGTVTRTASTADEHTAAGLFNSDTEDLDDWHLTFDNEFASGFARLVLVDQTPRPPDGLLPGTGGLTGPPILTPGNPSLYDLDIAASRSAFLALDDAGMLEGDLSYVLRNVTRAPEPNLPATAIALLASLAWSRAPRSGRLGSPLTPRWARRVGFQVGALR